MVPTRRGHVDTFGQGGEAAGWNLGEQMVLVMEEHVRGDERLESIAEGPRQRVRRVAPVMDCSDAEERREALAQHHRADVVSQRRDA